jgi:hypothetical protein
MQLAFVTKLGEDGNALGGVRLPHVRTTLPSGARVGGPLGLYPPRLCRAVRPALGVGKDRVRLDSARLPP